MVRILNAFQDDIFTPRKIPDVSEIKKEPPSDLVFKAYSNAKVTLLIRINLSSSTLHIGKVVLTLSSSNFLHRSTSYSPTPSPHLYKMRGKAE